MACTTQLEAQILISNTLSKDNEFNKLLVSRSQLTDVVAQKNAQVAIDNYIAYTLSGDEFAKYNYIEWLTNIIEANWYAFVDKFWYVSTLAKQDFSDIYKWYGKDVRDNMKESYKVAAILKYKYLEETNKLVKSLLDPADYNNWIKKK